MRITFYAPMKAPDHPVPSGDRSMARLLVRALEIAGHEVTLASRLRSRVADGDLDRQAHLARLGARTAARLIARLDPPPDLWFTYHLYYKAPDWIGPQVARALDIPYVVAEASLAPKRAGGPWDPSYCAVLEALAQAAAILPLNPHNAACLPDPAKLRELRPFLALPEALEQAGERAAARRAWAAELTLPEATPWLIAVGMMRTGDKLASYRLLAQALGMPDLAGRPWQVLLVGDGPARAEVAAAFAALPQDRTRLLGALSTARLHSLLAACDLLVWPAVNEAYGMALLEAQSLGLPVVAGREGGVAAVVSEGCGGRLVTPRDPIALAAAVAALLDDPAERRRLGAAGQWRARRLHGLPTASRQLDEILRRAVAEHGR